MLTRIDSGGLRLIQSLVALGILLCVTLAAHAESKPVKPASLLCKDTRTFNKGVVSVERVGDEYIVQVDATRLFEPDHGEKVRTGGFRKGPVVKLVFPADGCKWKETDPRVVLCTRPDHTIVNITPKEVVNPSWLRFETELVTRVTTEKTETKLEAKYWLGPITRKVTSEKPLRGMISFDLEDCTTGK